MIREPSLKSLSFCFSPPKVCIPPPSSPPSQLPDQVFLGVDGKEVCGEVDERAFVNLLITTRWRSKLRIGECDLLLCWCCTGVAQTFFFGNRLVLLLRIGEKDRLRSCSECFFGNRLDRKFEESSALFIDWNADAWTALILFLRIGENDRLRSCSGIFFGSRLECKLDVAWCEWWRRGLIAEIVARVWLLAHGSWLLDENFASMGVNGREQRCDQEMLLGACRRPIPLIWWRRALDEYKQPQPERVHQSGRSDWRSGI